MTNGDLSVEEMRAALGATAQGLPGEVVARRYALTRQVVSVTPSAVEEAKGGGKQRGGELMTEREARDRDRNYEKYMREKGLSRKGSPGDYQPGQFQGARAGKSGR